MSFMPPVPRTIYERAVLFDTGALEAIVDSRDRYHTQAAQCLERLKTLAYPFYVTPLIIAETQRRLLYKPELGIPVATRFLEGMYEGFAQIIRSNEEDERQALVYIQRYADQKLTLTDAVSMAVMKRLGLRYVFSFDWHFTLLGFQMLPQTLNAE